MCLDDRIDLPPRRKPCLLVPFLKIVLLDHGQAHGSAFAHHLADDAMGLTLVLVVENDLEVQESFSHNRGPYRSLHYRPMA